MSTDNQQLQTVPNESTFSLQSFEHAQRVAKMLASSSLIPSEYQGRVDNVMIAMEMANRMNISPLMVMQNLYIVKGKPGWSGQFVIAIINNSNRFSSQLKFELGGEGDNYGCLAWALDKEGVRIEGTRIDRKMVRDEGWGAKWKTMEDQMFKYRAAAFFGRLHTPDLLMGMQTAEEIIDVNYSDEVYTVDDLKALYQEKLPLLTKSEMDNAKRILENQESQSYKKLYKFLTSKVDGQD